MRDSFRKYCCIATLSSVVGITGCASVVTHVDRSTQRDGVTYWMPQKDVEVTVAFDSGKPTLSAVAGTAYADRSVAFHADFSTNLIGKNELNVEVNSRGLLQSAKSVTTSELSDALNALAGAVGTFHAVSELKQLAPTGDCPSTGSTTVLIHPPVRAIPTTDTAHVAAIPTTDTAHTAAIATTDTAHIAANPTTDAAQIAANTSSSTDFPGTTACKVAVSVRNIANGDAMPDSSRLSDALGDQSGFFYRQDLPYEVKVSVGSYARSFVIFLPNGSEVAFLPVARSLFANNSADLTFVDGVPTKYGQTVDGELVSIFKLPASVLQAYFAAVGAMFTSRKTALDNQAQYLQSVTALAARQQKTDACLRALVAQNQDAVTASCN